ncbi:hypothetical protein Droror1_Dr00014914 [Drosera rotundifolia]
MDRIGALPDELLRLILSFLATKDAVQSSVLSRRWRSLYRTVMCLDLSDGMHSSKKKFREFACRVLMPRYMDRIEKVRLLCDCGTKFDATYVTEWITGCVCYGVQVLELLFSDCKANMLPHCLFNSQTLVVLKLQFSAHFCQLLRIPPSVSLSNLKQLHLTGVRLPDNDSFSRLISGCPLLEDLRFVDCRFWEDEEAYYISSPSLRKFTVEKWVPSRCMSPDILNDDDSEVPVMTFDAKSLVYFKHHGNMIEDYCFENVNAFVEVDLHDKVCTWGFPRALLTEVSSIQILRLGGRILESLVDLICSGNSWLKLPMFPSLSRLHLSFSVCGGWELLPTLLISSPKLNTLVISE